MVNEKIAVSLVFGWFEGKKVALPPPLIFGSWCLGKFGTGGCVEGDSVAVGVQSGSVKGAMERGDTDGSVWVRVL